MAVVKLPSGKRARVPDDLSEEQVLDLLIDKLPDGDDKNELRAKRHPERKYDWISDVTGTVGAIGGGIAGGVAGFAAGGVGAIPGAVVGGAAGGAAGGALGETIEGWLDPRGRTASDIGRTAVTEGVFGAIPGGVGGIATKGGARVLGKTASALNPFSRLGSGDEVLKAAVKLPEKQKKQVATKITDFFSRELSPADRERIFRRLPDDKRLILDNILAKRGASVPANDAVEKAVKQGISRDSAERAYGLTPSSYDEIQDLDFVDVDDLFEILKDHKVFEKYINAIYNKTIQEGVKRGAVGYGVARGGAQGAAGIFDLLEDDEE